MIVAHEELLRDLAADYYEPEPSQQRSIYRNNGHALDVGDWLARYGIGHRGPQSYQGGQRWIPGRLPLGRFTHQWQCLTSSNSPAVRLRPAATITDAKAGIGTLSPRPIRAGMA